MLHGSWSDAVAVPNLLFVAVTAGSFLLGFVVRAVVTRDAKS